MYRVSFAWDIYGKCVLGQVCIFILLLVRFGFHEAFRFSDLFFLYFGFKIFFSYFIFKYVLVSSIFYFVFCISFHWFNLAFMKSRFSES